MTTRATLPATLTIIDALRDPRLFGALPAFRDLSTWGAWLVFLKACYGLNLDTSETAVFCRHTGRSTYDPPAGGYREAVAITGRQSGKSRIVGLAQAFEAITARPEADGTELYSLSIAQDQRASLRTVHRYACAPFAALPILAATVKGQTADALSLTTGVVIASYPCRPAAVRGLRACCIAADELAFYRSAEGNPVDAEMLRAVRPTLATTGGRLFILSSPYGQAGALWELHRQHFGRDDSDTLVWTATAPEMNPTLPADYLRRMEQDDPEAYRSEVLGEFRQGLSTFLDTDALQACVDVGVRERPFEAGQRCEAFCDPASGTGKDAFTLAIAARHEGRADLLVCRAWHPPFNPSSVIAEAAAVLKGYGLRSVTSDAYAGGFVSEGFAAHGITLVRTDRDRSAIYLDLLPLINAARVRLLDQPELLRELRGLERRRGSSGRDRVDHRTGAHDDRANAAAGALTLASGNTEPGILQWMRQKAEGPALVPPTDEDHAVLEHQKCRVAWRRPPEVQDGDLRRCSRCSCVLGHGPVPEPALVVRTRSIDSPTRF